MKKLFSLTFLFLTSVFLLHYLIAGQAVYGDGIYYWAYTRSIYFDHDLVITNELAHHYSHEGNNSINTDENKLNFNSKNIYPSNYRQPPGVSISWLPFFFIADIIVRLLSVLGFIIAVNGYSDYYQIIVGLGNIIFIIIGMIFLYKLIRSFYEKKIAVLSVFTILLSTNLFYYSSIDIVNSHPFSFMLSCLFFFIWNRTITKRKLYEWLMLGILLGLLTSTRNQDITLGSILAFEILYKLHKSRHESFLFIKKTIKDLLMITSGFIIGLFPQIYLWKIVHGNFLMIPYGGLSSFNFTNPHILEVFMNYKTGFLYYSPIIILAISGLLIIRNKSFIVIALLTSLVIQYYLIASWNGWQQGESYGIRMFISSMPIFTLGLSEIIKNSIKFLSFNKINIICSSFIIYNFITILIFQLLIQGETFDGTKNTQSHSLTKISTILVKNNLNFYYLKKLIFNE